MCEVKRGRRQASLVLDESWDLARWRRMSKRGRWRSAGWCRMHKSGQYGGRKTGRLTASFPSSLPLLHSPPLGCFCSSECFSSFPVDEGHS